MDNAKTNVGNPAKMLPYLGFALDYNKGRFWTHLINPSPDAWYNRIDMLTGGYSGSDEEIIETTKVVKEFINLKPLTAILIDDADLDLLDFVIWYHIDLFCQGAEPIQLWGSLPKYAGFGASEKQQTKLDCGIYGKPIELAPRNGKSVLDNAQKYNARKL